MNKTRRKPCYPFLESAIAVKGIKKIEIARKLKISQRTLISKFNGDLDFWYRETCIIQESFFPEYSKEQLFSRAS